MKEIRVFLKKGHQKSLSAPTPLSDEELLPMFWGCPHPNHFEKSTPHRAILVRLRLGMFLLSAVLVTFYTRFYLLPCTHQLETFYRMLWPSSRKYLYINSAMKKE